jgi:acetyl-CoA carboxylase biotin carboxyl carrier protein
VSVARVAHPEAASAQGTSTVKAPLLGSFYSTPKPGEPPFVAVGDRVEANTVVCIIEVMKLMNSVEAGVAGVVSAVHAADGELVEHGQPLFTIRAAEPA